MPARRKYDAVATTGTYRTANGEERKRYTKVGTVFEDDQGRMSLKLDAVPVGPDWSGWISFFAPQDNSGQPQQRQAQTAAPARPAPPAPADHDFPEDDDIPF